MTRKRLPAEERRKQILKSAIRVFARSTYHGATTKMISEEADVAEALIFRYFGNKRNLFTEAVTVSSKRMVDGLENILKEQTESPAAAFRGLLQYYLEMFSRNPDLAKMIFLVSAELDSEEVRSAYIPEQERALSALTRSVERWQRMGLMRRDVSPRAAAWLVLGCFQILALMKNSGRLDEVNVDLAIEFVRPYLEQAGL